MTLSKHVCHQVNGACPSRLAGEGGLQKTQTQIHQLYSVYHVDISPTHGLLLCAHGEIKKEMTLRSLPVFLCLLL